MLEDAKAVAALERIARALEAIARKADPDFKARSEEQAEDAKRLIEERRKNR